MTRCRRTALAAVLLLPLLSGCGDTGPSFATAPRCSATERLGLIAQSVPSATYVPCITALPAGWQSRDLDVQDGSTTFELVSDRAQGHPVHIAMRRSCDLSSGAPIPPRTVGGRTYLALRSIDPRFVGTMYDAFPGGCVTYEFDFQRGPHIALMAELQSSVGFVSRTDLAHSIHKQLGVELP
jgi:hypothetical protein